MKLLCQDPSLGLERKREELAACQMKVDEGIRAVKWIMELVAMA